MEIAAGPSIDASADALEQFTEGMSKGLTFQEMTHNVRALFYLTRMTCQKHQRF